MFLGKGVLKICSKFTREHPCRSVISIKLLCNFIELTLRHWCSPVNLLQIFRIPFPKNTSGRLFLLITQLTQPSITFHIEISPNQSSGNDGLKWFNRYRLSLVLQRIPFKCNPLITTYSTFECFFTPIRITFVAEKTANFPYPPVKNIFKGTTQ